MEAFDRLLAVVDRLLGPDGCDWDRAQRPLDLAAHLMGEAAELTSALDDGDDDAAEAELGDVLFVALLLARRHGGLDLGRALDRAAEKLTRRHPHVFAGATERPDWSVMKAAEAEAAGRTPSVLDGVPRALPPLARATTLTRRAAEVGFDWPDIAGVRDKLTEETVELDEALASGDPAAAVHEAGDLLFTLVNLTRFLTEDADTALRRANDRFERRLRAVEAILRAEGRTLRGTDPEALDVAWRRAKVITG
jgi:MazG family protein